MGFFPKDVKNSLAGKRPIWLHMVSVGEVQALRILLKKLRKEYPARKIAISTVTPTGNKIARSIAGEGDLVFYLPLDVSFIVRPVVDLINPCLFIIAETEIWPNLITYINKRDIPIISVNSRISDKSFKSYKLIKFLLQGILNKISFFCAQTQTDSQRLLALRVDPKKIKLTGNMKFDTSTLLSVNGERPSTWFDCAHHKSLRTALSERSESNGRSRTIDNAENADKKNNAEDADYRLKLGLNADDKLLVAGSTHSGEDEIILEAYKELLVEFTPLHPESPSLQAGDEWQIKFESTRKPRPVWRGVAGFTDLKLLLAPRHPERAKEIGSLVTKYGFVSVFVSQLAGEPVSGLAGLPVSPLNPRTRAPAHPRTVFILDTIGQLRDFYAVSDIVFVGGSLIKKGGQNILEPAALAKPIIFGPYMFNFRDIAELFLSESAAVLVKNKEELREKIKDLLLHPEAALELGRRGRELLLKNQGASERNLEIIKQMLNYKITK